MFRWQKTAVVALLVLPMVVHGEVSGTDERREIDEIVVIGRSVETSSTQVEVEREILVDTASALKDIPGANVNLNGLITGIAQYRGMYGDRVAVGIDSLGVISGGPNAMDAPLSYMSPMITETLVVERGIASVSSAPESIGGYINTRLDRGQFGEGDFGVSGMAGTRYSDNGDITTSAARLSLADARHRFSLVAEYDDANDISTPVGKTVPSRLQRKRHDISYGFADNGYKLLLYAGLLDTTDAGTPALPMDIRYIDTKMFGLQFEAPVTGSMILEGRFAYNDVDHLMDNFGLRQPPPAMRRRQNLTHGSGSQFHVSGLLSLDGSDLRLGVDGIAADHDSLITNPQMAMFRVNNFTGIERNVRGLFAEWSRQGESSVLELGLRYKRVETHAGLVGATGMPDPMGANVAMLADAFNSSNRALSWHSVDAVVKYRHALSNRSEWVLEAGSKTRAPSYQELYLWLPLQATGGLADGRTYIGNLGLDQERSNEIVLGVTSHVGRLTFSPQVFFRKVDGYIQGTPSSNMVANMVSTMMSGEPPLVFGNVDAEITGMDLAWKVDLTDHLFVDGIASYSRGERTDNGDKLYRLAPFGGSVGLTFMGKAWALKSEIAWNAKQDRVSAFNNERETAGYGLVNVSFAWDPAESLRVEARVDNLVDKAYQDHLAGINRAAGSAIPVGERLYGAGRTLSAGLIFRF